MLALVAWANPYPVQATPPQLHSLVFEIKPYNQILYVNGPSKMELTKVVPTKKAQPKKAQTQIPRRNNKFAPGYCTDYVARLLPVTWRGNANRWDDNARRQGYLVDKNPTPGAILVTNESRYGHVAYIESVIGTQLTFSEWNYAGRYTKSIRTMDITDPRIVAIIHI